MTEQQRQHLSALADGELDSELSRSTASALASNAELAATWERYHLIGSVLRRESVRPEYRDVSVRVREVLQTEPKIPAPSPVAKDPRLRAGPVLGMALAAGAAFFAVFALPQLVSDSRRALTPSPSVASAPLPQQFRLDAQGRRWHLDQPGLERKLDRFLVNHQVRSPVSVAKGFIPYATVVGYESGR